MAIRHHEFRSDNLIILMLLEIPIRAVVHRTRLSTSRRASLAGLGYCASAPFDQSCDCKRVGGVLAQSGHWTCYIIHHFILCFWDTNEYI